MGTTNLAQDLRSKLAAPAILLAPGIYDAFSAYRAQEAGFEAVFASGSALAATHLARPDIGLLTASETAEIIARIADRVDIPVFADADQGFGNAFMVSRSVRLLERAGVVGIQIEDQKEVKPSSEPLSRPLIETAMMVGKIEAARDALINQDIVISARTDAMSSEGFEAALERVSAYIEAGADMIFVESLTTRDEMTRLVEHVGGAVPLLHNLLRPGDEVTAASEVEQIGYSMALFPGTALGAVGAALDDAFGALRSNPTLPENAAPVVDRLGAKPFLSRD